MAFVFIPESFFTNWSLFNVPNDSAANIIINRLLSFIFVFILTVIIYFVYTKRRKSICIKGNKHRIIVEYGDIFEKNNCRKVITFDECFTTTVGNRPNDIKSESVCGQYLQKYPDIDMQKLIEDSGLKPAKGKSKYQGKVKYESGRIVRNGEYLLTAFTKLDENGLGVLTFQEYLDSLTVLWEELDKYYAMKDVLMPILGSGITRIQGNPLTQQELLDWIINSYKSSIHKLKLPSTLHIICKKRDDFSLNKIGESF